MRFEEDGGKSSRKWLILHCFLFLLSDVKYSRVQFLLGQVFGCHFMVVVSEFTINAYKLKRRDQSACAWIWAWSGHVHFESWKEFSMVWAFRGYHRKTPSIALSVCQHRLGKEYSKMTRPIPWQKRSIFGKKRCKRCVSKSPSHTCWFLWKWLIYWGENRMLRLGAMQDECIFIIRCI